MYQKKKKNPQFWRTASWNDGCGKAFIHCEPIIHIYSLPCLLTKISINIPILWMRRLNLREVTWPKCSHLVSIRARSMKPGLCQNHHLATDQPSCDSCILGLPEPTFRTRPIPLYPTCFQDLSFLLEKEKNSPEGNTFTGRETQTSDILYF